MSLRRPRRIFRASTTPLVRRPPYVRIAAVLVLVVAVVAIADRAVLIGPAMTLVPTSGVPAPVRAVTAMNADAAQVAVVDGGTLRLRDSVIRLFGVAAPERGVACRDAVGGPVDCGDEATHALAGIVRAQAVACRVEGADRQGRPLALCEVHGQDISQALVEGGWARATDAAPTLKDAEATARTSRRGLWAWNANASW